MFIEEFRGMLVRLGRLVVNGGRALMYCDMPVLMLPAPAANGFRLLSLGVR
jgi:hypothetical protein